MKLVRCLLIILTSVFILVLLFVHSAKGQFGLGDIPFAGGYINQALGYVDMAQRIRSGDLSAIPYAGGYISMAQNIAQTVREVRGVGVYENYQERSPEYFAPLDRLNRDEMNALINAQIANSPTEDQINRLSSYRQLAQITYQQESLGAWAETYQKIEPLIKPETIESAREQTAELLRQIDSDDSSENVVTTLYLYNLGSLFNKAGYFSDGENLIRRGIKISDSYFGDSNSDYPVWLEYFALMSFQNAFYQDAEILYQKSRDYRRNLNLDTDVNSGLLARCYLIQHRFSEAQTYLKEMLTSYESQMSQNNSRSTSSASLRPRLAEVLTNFGVVLYFLGFSYDAEECQKKAIEMVANLQANNNYTTLCLIGSYERLAQIRINQERYDEAKKLLDTSEKLKKQYYQYSYKDQTDAYGRSYRQRIARSTTEMEKFLVSGLNLRAQMLRKEGKPEEAEAIYTKNLQILEEADEKDVFQRAEIYQLRGQLRTEYDDPDSDDALSDFRQARKIVINSGKHDHHYTAILDCDLAELFIKRGDWHKAEVCLKDAKNIFSKINVSADSLVRFHSAAAQMYHGQSKEDLAFEELDQAIKKSLEARRNVSINEQERADAFVQYYFLYETLVEWRQNSDKLDDVYFAMETSRALGLQELIKTSGVDPLQGVDTDIADHLRANLKKCRSDLNEARSKLASVARRSDMTKEETQILSEEVVRCQKETVSALNAIKTASPVHQKSSGDEQTPIPFDTLCSNFSERGLTACEFLIGREKGFLLVYGAGFPKAELFPLRLDESAAEQFVPLLSGVTLTAGPLHAERLEAILGSHQCGILERLASASDENDDALHTGLTLLWPLLFPDEELRQKLLSGDETRSLLILPDGILSRLPFEALITRNDGSAPVRYLLDEKPVVTYAPSAGLYYDLQQRKMSQNNAVLTCGNPDYEIKVAAVQTAAGRPVRTQPTKKPVSADKSKIRFAELGQPLTPLPETANETRWIADCCAEQKIPVTRLDAAETTEKNIRDGISDKRLVHFACHGLVDNRYGNLFGALAVTPENPNDPDNDGFLTLAEMFDLKLGACELAILSACDTNRGVNQRGEGTWSLGRGMIVSGARRVITSDWSVDDASTATLMALFVDNSVGKSHFSDADCAAALQKAKRSIRENEEHHQWSRPYYWAPFVLIGPK